MNVAVPEYLVANKLWLIKVGKARASARVNFAENLAEIDCLPKRKERGESHGDKT